MVTTESPEEISPKETTDICDEMHDAVFSKRVCCFWIPCLGRSDHQTSTVGSVWWERIRAAEKDDRWWSKGLDAFKRMRNWSEIVAGPKWKTFIRRFNKNHRSHGCGGTAAIRHGKFHYDPLSYSLNFDEGPGQNSHVDEDYVHRDFSSRYASIPASAKSSMDLGKDGPSFL